MRKINVLDIDDGNSVECVSVGACSVVYSSRLDLSDLFEINDVMKPGIYILYNDSHVYVGQSATSIKSRLQKHDKTKSWWTDVLFFADLYNSFSKASADYMEELLIKVFDQNSKYIIDNKTMGNTSFINDGDLKLSNHNLKLFYNLSQLTHCSIMPSDFDVKRNNKDVSSSNIIRSDVRIKSSRRVELSDSDGNMVKVISSNTLINMYVDLVRFLYFEYTGNFNIRHDVVSDKVSSTALLGLFPSVLTKSGKSQSLCINYDLFLNEDAVYLYTNLSDSALVRSIYYFAEVSNLKAEFI